MRWSLRWKMLAWIALPTLAIYVAVLGTLVSVLRAENRAEIEDAMTRRAVDAAGRFDGAFREAAAIALATARLAEVGPDLTAPAIYAQLRGNVGQDPNVYGSAMAYEPGLMAPPDELFCPYVFRDGDGLREMNIGRDVLDWHGDDRWQWWHVPRRTGAPVWTDPYYDDGAGETLMITFSAPFERDGAFAGVVTVDVDLRSIRERIGAEVLGGLPFVIMNPRGEFVFRAREAGEVVGLTVFDVAERYGRPELAERVRPMLAGETGVARFAAWDGEPPAGMEHWRESLWAFYAPMESTGWTVVAMTPERQALAGVNERMRQGSVALAGTLLLIVGAIVLVSGRLVAPVRRLRDGALRVAHGDLETVVEGRWTRDEIGDLGRAFNKMTDDLRGHVERLAEERSARERLERDMEVARDIQQGLLPDAAPPIDGYRLAGWSRPADETGGDYYDWQALPDGRLAIVLADVTGHGLGPALVTAFCRAYARAVFRQHVDLPAALGELNGLLGQDLSGSRFITFVAALIRPNDDETHVLSAGHGPLLHYSAASGEVRADSAHAVPLGVMPEFEFDEARPFTLRGGDVLALVTDGFFEWAREDGEMYGTDRLRESLARHAGGDPTAIIGGLLGDVEAFVGDSVQPDDLTAVVIKRVADA
jgi:sigma-B regulation protein RsbU (phosphoserine phosphatase)